MNQLPAYDLDAVRRAFPVTDHLTYLNHASTSSLAVPTQEALSRATELMGCDPMASFAAPPGSRHPSVFAEFSQVMGALVNAPNLHDVIGVVSTSVGVNVVAQALDWQPGDNVIFCDAEFPSNAFPWMLLERRGVEVRIAPADGGGATVAAFEPLVDDRTRLIAVSALQFFTGHRTDLAAFGAFCHERGILFAVDAIQSVAHMPIDVQADHIDVLVAGSQKSLMGPPGQGFLYVRDEIAERMTPGVIGPNAVKGWEHWLKYDLTPRDGAFRLLLGTSSTPGMHAVIASVHYLQSLGIANIDAWTRHLSQVAYDDLTERGYEVITPADPAHRGSIVTFQVGDPADPAGSAAFAKAAVAHLRTHNIQVGHHLCWHGIGHVRISTHCYNTEDEVRRVGAVLEEFAG